MAVLCHQRNRAVAVGYVTVSIRALDCDVWQADPEAKLVQPFAERLGSLVRLLSREVGRARAAKDSPREGAELSRAPTAGLPDAARTLNARSMSSR